MSKRPDLFPILPKRAPTIFTHEMADGIFWGGFLGIIGSSLMRGARLPLAIGATLLGALIGGENGRNRMQREQSQLQSASTPTFLNRGIIDGLFTGWALSDLWDLAKREAKSTSRASFGLGGTIIAACAVIGSILRHNVLQRDFDQAIAEYPQKKAQADALITRAHTYTLPPIPDMLPTRYKDSVSPDEAVALEEKQQQKPLHHMEKHPPHEGHTAHAEKHEQDAPLHIA